MNLATGWVCQLAEFNNLDRNSTRSFQVTILNRIVSPEQKTASGTTESDIDDRSTAQLK